MQDVRPPAHRENTTAPRRQCGTGFRQGGPGEDFEMHVLPSGMTLAMVIVDDGPR